MTDVRAKDGLLEGDFGVGSWPRHPRGQKVEKVVSGLVTAISYTGY